VIRGRQALDQRIPIFARQNFYPKKAEASDISTWFNQPAIFRRAPSPCPQPSVNSPALNQLLQSSVHNTAYAMLCRGSGGPDEHDVNLRRCPIRWVLRFWNRCSCGFHYNRCRLGSGGLRPEQLHRKEQNETLIFSRKALFAYLLAQRVLDYSPHLFSSKLKNITRTAAYHLLCQTVAMNGKAYLANGPYRARR